MSEKIDLDFRPTRWVIEFNDERDFCRYASLLIGASYVDGLGALNRFKDGSLWGERTYGKVTAHSENNNSDIDDKS